MYTATDIVEMGNAQELILSIAKPEPMVDDAEPFSADPEEHLDR